MIAWDWVWDKLTLKPKLLNAIPLWKRKKIIRGKLGVFTNQRKKITVLQEGRKEDRKQNQGLSYIIVFLHPLLLQTSSLHVAGRAGSRSLTLTAREERTQPHHDQYPRLEHYREELCWVPILGPYTVLVKCYKWSICRFERDEKGYRVIMGPHGRI